jgi:hypothetical protein
MAKRDKRLLILGIRTGYCISELLSFRVQDMQQHGKIVDKVAVARKAMKGGKAGKATGRTGKLGTQAMRKTFATDVYDKLNRPPREDPAGTGTCIGRLDGLLFELPRRGDRCRHPGGLTWGKA